MNIVTLQESTEALRKPLLNHEVYGQLGSPNSIQRFMELHVYAVWDFMSLLKALQQQLTCVTTPWVPPADPIAARMINQIVVGEESDLDTEGQPSSHFDLYLQAMEQVGADTSKILILVDKLITGNDLETAMSEAEAQAARTAVLEGMVLGYVSNLTSHVTQKTAHAALISCVFHWRSVCVVVACFLESISFVDCILS